MRAKARTTTAALGAALLLGCMTAPAQSDPAHGAKRVLVFSKTAGFRHDSIPQGIEAVQQLGRANGFTVDTTEDAAAFTGKNLSRYDAVVFMSTTGDVLDAAQQDAFEGYVRHGGGYVGVHSAADTEYDWAFYGGLAGAYFQNHPAIQPATVNVEDRAHASTSHLGRTWERTDEWYNYRSNPREHAHVLASLDETSYTGGTMEGDHPIAWCQDYQGGRAFYTGGGHTKESYADPAFRQHLLGGIRWAIGDVQADCRPETGYRPLFDGASLDGWRQAGPGGFTRSDDGTLTSTGGLGLLWYTPTSFGSYSLKLDWKAAGDDNSGVFVGFPPSDDPWSAVDNGYEIQIDATDVPEKTTGSVYGFRSADVKKRDRALNPPGEWNTYEIRVQGERLRVWLNGVKINDFTNTDPARSLRDGHIGIQNHGAGDDVSFRDIRIKELPVKG
ncbi:ThuA domain-containing protein, partial [Streptomyces adustus]